MGGMDPQVSTPLLSTPRFHPHSYSRIYSVNSSGAGASSVEAVAVRRAFARPKILFIESRCRLRNSTRARPPNSLSRGTLFVQSATARVEKMVLFARVDHVMVEVSRSSFAKWVLWSNKYSRDVTNVMGRERLSTPRIAARTARARRSSRRRRS